MGTNSKENVGLWSLGAPTTTSFIMHIYITYCLIVHIYFYAPAHCIMKLSSMILPNCLAKDILCHIRAIINTMSLGITIACICSSTWMSWKPKVVYNFIAVSLLGVVFGNIPWIGQDSLKHVSMWILRALTWRLFEIFDASLTYIASWRWATLPLGMQYMLSMRVLMIWMSILSGGKGGGH
jgi:hypothetical protein